MLEGGGIVEFVGTWSHFLFPSGFIMVNIIERGAFIVKIAEGKGSTSGPGFPVKTGSTWSIGREQAYSYLAVSTAEYGSYLFQIYNDDHFQE